MGKKEIWYSFSVGYRCNSVQFLRKYGMSRFSGPFDWMYIDIQTSVENIANDFSNYLSDIVVIKKNENILSLENQKNYEHIRSDINLFFDKNQIYMKQVYESQLLPINQNFSNPISNDIYEWDRTCIFLHHDLRKPDEVQKIKTRISRFSEAVIKTPEKVLLLYISKILHDTGITDEMERLSRLYSSLDKDLNIVSILCCSDAEEGSYMIDNLLFIIKKVPPYQEQYENCETDNNFEWLEWGMQGLNFDSEFKIIENYYQFNLIDKEEI